MVGGHAGLARQWRSSECRGWEPLAQGTYIKRWTSPVAVEDVEPIEADFSFKPIYGAYKPQPGTSPDQAKLDARRHLGARFGTIRDGACFALELCGVELGDLIRVGHSLRIPVAALVASKVEMRSDGSATTVFIRYMNISPLDNVLNRPGIFALRRQEDRCPVALGGTTGGRSSTMR